MATRVFTVQVVLECLDKDNMPSDRAMENVLEFSTIREALLQAFGEYNVESVSLTVVGE